VSVTDRDELNPGWRVKRRIATSMTALESTAIQASSTSTAHDDTIKRMMKAGARHDVACDEAGPNPSDAPHQRRGRCRRGNIRGRGINPPKCIGRQLDDISTRALTVNAWLENFTAGATVPRHFSDGHQLPEPAGKCRS